MVAFGTRHSVKKAKAMHVFLNGIKVCNVPSVKYLGFTLDVTLNFKSHINGIVRSVIHKNAVLNKLMKFLNQYTALTIYKTMILPYFDYCNVIYQGTNVDSLDKLQRLQNKCLKTCLNLSKTHDTDNLHKTAKCAMLDCRRQAHMCNFMFLRLSRQDLRDVREVRTRLHDGPLFKVEKPSKEQLNMRAP